MVAEGQFLRSMATFANILHTTAFPKYHNFDLSISFVELVDFALPLNGPGQNAFSPAIGIDFLNKRTPPISGKSRTAISIPCPSPKFPHSIFFAAVFHASLSVLRESPKKIAWDSNTDSRMCGRAISFFQSQKSSSPQIFPRDEMQDILHLAQQAFQAIESADPRTEQSFVPKRVGENILSVAYSKRPDIDRQA